MPEGLGSTLGIIAYVSYNINWYNFTTGHNGYYAGNAINASTTWTHNDWSNTGTGLVGASMGGTVYLVWGGTCTIDNPYSETTIN